MKLLNEELNRIKKLMGVQSYQDNFYIVESVEKVFSEYSVVIPEPPSWERISKLFGKASEAISEKKSFYENLIKKDIEKNAYKFEIKPFKDFTKTFDKLVELSKTNKQVQDELNNIIITMTGKDENLAKEFIDTYYYIPEQTINYLVNVKNYTELEAFTEVYGKFKNNMNLNIAEAFEKKFNSNKIIPKPIEKSPEELKYENYLKAREENPIPRWMFNKWIKGPNESINLNIFELKDKVGALDKFKLEENPPSLNNKFTYHSWENGEHIIREILDLRMPTGEDLILYKSSGTGAPTLKKKDDWQVINGFASTMDGSDIKWFIKTPESTQYTLGTNQYLTDLHQFLRKNEPESLSKLSSFVGSAERSGPRVSDDLAETLPTNLLVGRRVTNNVFETVPQFIDRTQWSSPNETVQDLNVRIATALDDVFYKNKPESWNLIPRKGFEKFGISNLRDYMRDNIKSINGPPDVVSGTWSVNFR